MINTFRNIYSTIRANSRRDRLQEGTTPLHVYGVQDINDFLVETDGTWDGTSLLLNGEPLFADRLRIRLKVERDGLDRIVGVNCQHFAMLQEVADEDTDQLLQEAGQISLFPGSVEVGVNGKTIRIENLGLVETQRKAGSYAGQIQPDPNKYVVTYSNISQDLDDPVLAWRSKNRYHAENLFEVLDEVAIDFNGPEDHWYVAISLFKGRHFAADQVTKVVLGVSKNIGHIDPFAL